MDIVLLTSRTNGLPVLFIQKALKNEAINVKAVILSHNVRSKKKYLKQKIQKVLRHGFTTIFTGFYLRKMFVESDFLKVDQSLNEVCESKNIKFIEIQRTVNLSKEDKNKLALLNFDVGISIGNSYLGKWILNKPNISFINIHHELLPSFKGAQSIIWQLYFKSTISGYTIHKMNQEIDGGQILYRKEIPLKLKSNLKDTVHHNLRHIKLDSVDKLIKLLETDKMKGIKIDETEKTFTTPNLWQFIRILKNHSNLVKESRA